jgi:para-nitrobenzyl esterase
MFRRTLPSALLLAALASIGSCTRPISPPPELAPAPAEDANRRLGRGAIVGFVDAAGGHSWLGVPYAAPPVGALRWRPPAPGPEWDGTRNALRAGAPCVQYGWALTGLGKDGSHEGREDCLYLNVHAPRMAAAEAPGARLPVMVWVHGGANTVGHGASYDGSLLARAGRVIVVTFNYRLGPFGWFILPRGADATAPEIDPLAASGNFGILDELAVLEWVHQHIAAFGGDPGNVTVFGESAGATDALALLVSPLATGRVHRLIIQSLGFGFASTERALHYTDEASPGGAYSSGEILLKALVHAGRAADRATAKALAARLRGDEIASLLRGMDPWDFYALYHPSNIETDLFPTVFQDGAVLRAGALEDLLADPARHLALPTILGTNRDEPKLFMAFDPRLVGTVVGAPLWIRDVAAYEREAGYRSALWRANGVERPARALAGAGSPTWTYRFDWRDEGRRFGVLDLGRLVGAAHGLEIPFVLGSFDTTPGHDMLFTTANRPGRERLSAEMMSYWAEFAARGRPGRGRDGTLPDWSEWRDDAPLSLVLDTAANGGLRLVSQPVSREDVVRLMEERESAGPAACAMFRATFRTRVDPWADAAWQRYRDGACARGGTPRLPP